MRVRGRLVDDEHLHQAILAYATDYQLLGTSTRPLGVSSASRPERVKMIISLDHSIWFHAPIRTDEWFLYDMVVDYVGSNRAFTRGRIYTRDGILAASVAQEGILRIGPADDNTTPTTNSKL
jgi:acyl-CoA thioesterase II